jgi:hypothetical protein
VVESSTMMAKPSQEPFLYDVFIISLYSDELAIKLGQILPVAASRDSCYGHIPAQLKTWIWDFFKTYKKAAGRRPGTFGLLYRGS